MTNDAIAHLTDDAMRAFTDDDFASLTADQLPLYFAREAQFNAACFARGECPGDQHGCMADCPACLARHPRRENWREARRPA